MLNVIILNPKPLWTNSRPLLLLNFGCFFKNLFNSSLISASFQLYFSDHYLELWYGWKNQKMLIFAEIQKYYFSLKNLLSLFSGHVTITVTFFEPQGSYHFLFQNAYTMFNISLVSLSKAERSEPSLFQKLCRKHLVNENRRPIRYEKRNGTIAIRYNGNMVLLSHKVLRPVWNNYTKKKKIVL